MSYSTTTPLRKERCRWEQREERLLSRLEAAPLPRPDLKPDSGSLSVHEELTGERSAGGCTTKETLSQQLGLAEQGKVEAEKQIEEQQLKIEELQAKLHLAEVRTKWVECETLTETSQL